MVDHGADAAAVIANAATDITKGMMQISAAGLKQLFLLLYEGKDLQVGETNMEKLIKMLDAEDCIKDIIVQKEYTEKFVELSRKHGVTYAVAEMPDGKMVVYYPESQDNRVQNVMKDILGDMNHGPEEKEAIKNDLPEENNKEIDVAAYVNKALYEEDSQQSKTVVFFDEQMPNHYTEFNKKLLKNGEAEITCTVKSDEKRNEQVSLEEGISEAYQYEKRMCFQAEGTYSKKKIEEQIKEICLSIKERERVKTEVQEKANLIDSIEAKDAALGGSTYIVQDQVNKGNLVVIHKQLNPLENGEWKTSNTIKVFSEGKLQEQAEPKQAILSYENYGISEKHGKNAALEYEKLMSGDYFKQIENESELNSIQGLLEIEESFAEKTVVMFDGQNPDHYIKLSQDLSGENTQTSLTVSRADGMMKELSREEAAQEAFSYGQRMYFEADGLYTDNQIREHIGKICTDIKRQEAEKIAVQEKEKVIDDILSKNSALEGSLHTITDSGNKNNVIVIYKQLEQADGQIKTANKVMVYADGKLTEKITPKEAIAGYEKYKAAEKQGKSAERQYQKILSGEYFKGKEINKEVFAVQNTLSIKENDGEKTVVLFDGKNPNHYVKISQERQENGSYEIKKMIRQEDGQMKAVSYEAAAQEGYTYEQRMHFEVDGLYTEKEIEEHIGKVCADIKKQDMTKEAIRDKENVIDNLLAKTAALNGSIHTVIDAGNRNNMVVIYKQLEPTPDGEFKTVNKAMVFYNGEIVQDISPKQAVLSYEKYKIMEKQGKSAEKHLEKILAGELFKDRDSNKDIESGRRPLSSYEKEIEKIKELEPKKAEIKEMVVESPIKAVKEPAELGR